MNSSSSSTTNSRRIAPAPSSSPDEGPSMRASSLAAQLGKSGIKRASTACQSCKQIKRKCDQQQPCSNCVKTHTECIYDQTQDGRRRAARKRTVEELELKRDALDTILEALRDPDDEHVVHLLYLIKTNSPLDEIINYASAHDQHISEDQIASLAVAVDTGLSRKSVLSVNAMCDIPLVKVPAEPWTSVTKDDDFVSHLISTYFTWYHQAFPCLAKDIFVEEMRAGNLQSKYCSRLLVNAMLALSCHFSDHYDTCSNPGDHTSRGRDFLNEAMRSWAEEIGRPSLTTLQGGQILAVTLTLVGKDRISVSYVDLLNEIGGDLLFKSRRSASQPEPAQYQKSLNLALWSLYQLSISYSISFMRSRSYTVPEIEHLQADDEAFYEEAPWIPYPEQGPSVETHLGEHVVLQYELYEIGAEVGSLLFDVNEKPLLTNENVEKLAARLDAFSVKMPSIDVRTNPNPHSLNLHLLYHWFRINLFNFYQDTSPRNTTGRKSSKLPDRTQEQCLLSAQAAVDLFQCYSREYGVKVPSLWMPQTACTIAYILIDLLEDEVVQQLFHEICIVITSAARRWYVMRGHARMLFITAEQRGQVIPPRTHQVLSYIALDSWRPDGHKFFDASMYPNYALARGADPRSAGMGDLLEQWANFNIRQSVEDARTPASEMDRARSLALRASGASGQVPASPQTDPRKSSSHQEEG